MLEPPIGAPSLPAAVSKVEILKKHWFIFWGLLPDGG